MKRGGKLAAPRSELERQLAEIWAELLDIDQIGIDEDVFALGADSITMTQMILRLRGAFWRRSSRSRISSMHRPLRPSRSRRVVGKEPWITAAAIQPTDIARGEG